METESSSQIVQLVNVLRRVRRLRAVIIQPQYFEGMIRCVCGWIVNATGVHDSVKIYKCKDAAQIRSCVESGSPEVLIYVAHEAEYQPDVVMCSDHGGSRFVLALHTEHTCTCRRGQMYNLSWHFSPMFGARVCDSDRCEQPLDRDKTIYMPLFAHICKLNTMKHDSRPDFSSRKWDVCMPLNTPRRRDIARRLHVEYGLRVSQTPWHNSLNTSEASRLAKVLLNVHACGDDTDHFVESFRISEFLGLASGVVVTEVGLDSKAWSALLHPSVPMQHLSSLFTTIACICSSENLWNLFMQAQSNLKQYFTYSGCCMSRALSLS